VQLTVFDTVFLSENFDGPYGEDFILADAPGQSLTGDAVAIGAVSALGGNVTIDAGDDVHMPDGTRVEADQTSGQILIRGDYRGELTTPSNPDVDTGTTIPIEADLTAPTVIVEGGSDLDFIELRSTAHLLPGSTLILRGNGGSGFWA